MSPVLAVRPEGADHSRDDTVTPEEIDDLYALVKAHAIIIPWPIAYERLRTRFVRNRLALERFEQEMRSQRVNQVDDAPYRQEALALSIESSLRRGRPLSMVDCVLRLLIDDVSTKIRYFVTFNQRDFVDVCTRRQIELWYQ
jgi:hypothetical protein